MNWEVISAVATIFGVIGGLVSVYFLVHEVRRNAMAIEGATVQSLMTFEQAVFTMMIDNAATYQAGQNDRDSLAPLDRYKFDNLAQAWMSLTYSAFTQYGQGLIDLEVWEAYRQGLSERLRHPGFAASWDASRLKYPASFRAAVASI
jgi:hypothetical protein